MKKHIRYDITPIAEKKLKEYCERVGKKESRVIFEYVRDLPETTRFDDSSDSTHTQKFGGVGKKFRIFKGVWLDEKLVRKLNLFCRKIGKTRDLVLEQFIQSLPKHPIVEIREK